MAAETIPANLSTSLTGTYVLVCFASNPQVLQVGRLGQVDIQRGFYMYIGSAFGPGGVRARVTHHCQFARRPHWHIDYLRAVTQLWEIWWTHDAMRREHQWATQIVRLRGVSIPFKGFGASDCDCPSHLFFCSMLPSFARVRQLFICANGDRLSKLCRAQIHRGKVSDAQRDDEVTF